MIAYQNRVMVLKPRIDHHLEVGTGLFISKYYQLIVQNMFKLDGYQRSSKKYVQAILLSSQLIAIATPSIWICLYTMGLLLYHHILG